jgi:glycosyltransferase involved in cell wall biosynthesis
MKVLIVCSGNFPDPEVNFPIYQAFIYDQMNVLSTLGVEFDTFLIRGKGIKGYLKNITHLRQKIKQGSFDLVHAHFSLSGLVSILASPIPVVITFHGSDINNNQLNIISSITALKASAGIYVSEQLKNKAFIKTRRPHVIPCGIDLNIFFPEKKEKVRDHEGLSKAGKYILFSSRFDNPVKNVALAQSALSRLEDSPTFLELEGRTRDQVRSILNAVDVLLMTSISEGSPQIIKEAMACNCPVVSTDVGDVEEVLGNTQNCYIANTPQSISEALIKIFKANQRTNGREKIKRFDNQTVAREVLSVYQKL